MVHSADGPNSQDWARPKEVDQELLPDFPQGTGPKGRTIFLCFPRTVGWQEKPGLQPVLVKDGSKLTHSAPSGIFSVQGGRPLPSSGHFHWQALGFLPAWAAWQEEKSDCSTWETPAPAQQNVDALVGEDKSQQPPEAPAPGPLPAARQSRPPQQARSPVTPHKCRLLKCNSLEMTQPRQAFLKELLHFSDD